MRHPLRILFSAWSTFPIVVTVAVALMSWMPAATAQERRAVDDDGRIVDFARDIAPIFRDRCLECHNVDEAKADFRIDDPETVSYYVEPEDVEASTMFIDYLLSDDPDMMMPPPSTGGPLTPQELTLIRVWIEEGAVWPEGATVAAVAEADADAPTAEPPPAPPKSLVARVWAFQGFFHPATVHFPIALFLVGALFVVLGWFWPPLGNQIPLACLLLGAPTAIASTAMGWAFAVEEGYGSWAKVDLDSEVFWHRWSGVIVTVVSLVLAAIALINLMKGSKKLERTWKIGLLLVAGMVGAVGHQGGELSYGADFYPKAFRILMGTEGEQAEPSVAEAGESETPAADAVAARDE
jgi:hypothetical protein